MDTKNLPSSSAGSTEGESVRRLLVGRREFDGEAVDVELILACPRCEEPEKGYAVVTGKYSGSGKEYLAGLTVWNLEQYTWIVPALCSRCNTEDCPSDLRVGGWWLVLECCERFSRVAEVAGKVMDRPVNLLVEARVKGHGCIGLIKVRSVEQVLSMVKVPGVFVVVEGRKTVPNEEGILGYKVEGDPVVSSKTFEDCMREQKEWRWHS